MPVPREDVAGCTRTSARLHSVQICENQTQSTRQLGQTLARSARAFHWRQAFNPQMQSGSLTNGVAKLLQDMQRLSVSPVSVAPGLRHRNHVDGVKW